MRVQRKTDSVWLERCCSRQRQSKTQLRLGSLRARQQAKAAFKMLSKGPWESTRAPGPQHRSASSLYCLPSLLQMPAASSQDVEWEFVFSELKLKPQSCGQRVTIAPTLKRKPSKQPWRHREGSSVTGAIIRFQLPEGEILQQDSW